MKRNHLRAICIVFAAVLLSLATAYAATSTLSPGPHNGTANSSSSTKSGSGGPSMYVNSISNMTQPYFWCRLRCGTSAATPAYKFDSTGSKTMYYLSGQGNKGDSIFVRAQTHADEPDEITVRLTWYP